MLSFFKSRNYRNAIALLDNQGFNNNDFRQFLIGDIVKRMVSNRPLFQQCLNIFRQVKLTPICAIKIILIVQHILQVDSQSQQNEQLFSLLQQLNIRIKRMIKAVRTKDQHIKLSQSQDYIHSSKQLHSQQQSSKCKNSTTLILAKIVLPVIQLQERIIFAYDIVYAAQGIDMDLNQCWATLNILKKFVDLSPSVEEIGRYYFKEYAQAIVCLIKVINNDIQKLYRRIRQYICRRVTELQTLVEEGQFQTIQSIHQQKIEQFLQLTEEVDAVNELIRLMYNGKYFIAHLITNNIFIPNLFTNEFKLEMFYEVKRKMIRKFSKKHSSNKQQVFGLQEVEEV